MGVRRANSDLLFVCDTYFTGCFYFITSLNLDDEALTLWATCNRRDFFEKSWFAVVGLQLVYPLTVLGKETEIKGIHALGSLEIRRGRKLKRIII